jgi:glycosyltransferase involved in cell wall biosynthesis
MPKAEARDLLGISKGRKVILAGAERPDAYWKGFDLFKEALQATKVLDPLVLLFGNVPEDMLSEANVDVKSLGMINDRNLLRTAYSAADVFVAPSRMESFGKTLAESLATGTPVVAFDATGPRDIVDHKVNGYLAKPYEVEDLAAGIRWVLSHENPKLLAENAVKKARSFDITVIAKNYADLYERKLSSVNKNN